jgi:hypothetical protein
VFLDLSGIPELAMCGVAGFVCVHADGAIFFGALREMEREFVLDVAIEFASSP